MKSIRVLIVDDSPVFRSVLYQLLSSFEDIEIVGMASDPLEAKDLIIAHQPNVITLDVEMPRMDGITFLKRLMRQRPTPVVMISSYTRENSLRTLEALDAGAVDFVAKPPPETPVDLEEFGQEVMMKLRAAVQVRMRPLMARPPNPASHPSVPLLFARRSLPSGLRLEVPRPYRPYSRHSLQESAGSLLPSTWRRASPRRLPNVWMPCFR